MQDIRFAVRLLLRDRGFAATAVFVLGIGIGVNNVFHTIMASGALGAIAATLTVAALIGCYVPARRAIRLDPVAAIRGD